MYELDDNKISRHERKENRKPTKKSKPDPSEEIVKAIFKIMGGTFFLWLILHGVASGAPHSLFLVIFLSLMGAGLGMAIGVPWAVKVSLFKRYTALIVTGALGAALWCLVALGIMGASTTAIWAVLLTLSWFRWYEIYKWPW